MGKTYADELMTPNTLQSTRRRHAGFTLIELMVVVIIIVLLTIDFLFHLGSLKIMNCISQLGKNFFDCSQRNMTQNIIMLYIN